MTGTKVLFCRKIKFGMVVMLLAGIVAGGIVVSQLAAQFAPAKPEKPVAKAAPTTYQVDHFAGRAGKYYSLIWGVDSIR